LSLPASLYSQAPATHSMISGAPVLKVRVAGRITPTDFLVPSAKVMPWLTHLPSKYTLAWVLTLTLSIFSVGMEGAGKREKTGGKGGETAILGDRCGSGIGRHLHPAD
jgi:hypothetical protein